MKQFLKILLGAFLGTLLALFFMFLLGMGMIGSLASAGKSEPAVPKKAVLKIDFKVPVTEQATETFNFSFNPLGGTSADMNSTISILNAVKAIDKAAEDPAIQFIYMTPDQLNMSLSCAEELRAALVRFRQSGKAIVAYIQNLNNTSLYMASVADKVILNTYADCMLSGLSAQVMFYKDLIDQLGIDVQLFRHGKYKSAGEPYIKNDISPENREQYEVMLKSLWDAMAEDIVASRDFSKEDLNKWIDDIAIDDCEAALEKGLVDELWYDDQVNEYVCGLYGVEKIKDIQAVSLKTYAAASVKNNYRAKDKIAVIYADGEIIMGNGSEGTINEGFAKEIAKAREDSSVKAVVFRVNSPGGSVQASAIIEREIELLRQVKPVIASYGEYAASGGYWISCASDKIFTDKTTLTGSIGVFGLIPNFGRAFKKTLHINTVEVSSHRHGSMISGFAPLDAEESEYMQKSIENIYDKFTNLVAGSRSMTVEQVDEIAQGRVWAGSDALGIGLVDEIGGLTEAINYAASTTGVDNYQLVEYPEVKGMYEKLLSSLGGAKVSSPETPADALEATSKWLLNISGPEVVARVPYMFEIK